MMNLADSGTRIQVLGVETQEHGPISKVAQSPRLPREDGAVALTLAYANPAWRGAPANNRKLVLFLRAIGETEKNL